MERRTLYGEQHPETDSANPVDTRALIVGKIEWGANAAASETLTLYAPSAADLAQGAPILDPWTTPALDQSQFTSLILQFKDTSQMDEIRFGATYDDVIGVGGVIPEPTSFVLAALGLLGLMGFRRRRNR